MKRSQIFLRILLAAYAVLMLWLLFGQRMGRSAPGTYLSRLAENFNLIPLATVRDFIETLGRTANPYLAGHAVINLAGNVVMFVPLGILLPACFAPLRRFGRCMAAAAAVILAVELAQLFTLLGVCDVDDLLLNTAGAAAGWLLYAGIRKLLPDA